MHICADKHCSWGQQQDYMQGTEASRHMPCPAVHWFFFSSGMKTVIQQSLIWRKLAHMHILKPFWGVLSGEAIGSWDVNDSIICAEELSYSDLFYLCIVQNSFIYLFTNTSQAPSRSIMWGGLYNSYLSKTQNKRKEFKAKYYTIAKMWDNIQHTL